MKKTILMFIAGACCFLTGTIAQAQACRADMIARNGMIIQSFTGYGCRDAMMQCQNDLSWRQSRGMNPFARCQLAMQPQPPPQPQPDRWVQVDVVTYRDRETGIAVRNCQAARAVDNRCVSMRNFQCGECSFIPHSDQSSYIVYQLMGGGHQPPMPPPYNPPHQPPMPPPHQPPHTPPGGRQFVQTYHFYDKDTAVAKIKCDQARARMPECSNSRAYDCTPCTIEKHTDHSQFDLFRLF